jgi:hypothetical protein
MEEFISYTMPRHIICLQQLSLAKNITFHNIKSHNTLLYINSSKFNMIFL